MKVEVTSVTLDPKTKSLLDEYAKEHVVSRSSAIRLIVNDFFLQLEKVA